MTGLVTFRRGITPNGRRYPVSPDDPEPTLPERHAARFQRACTTLKPPPAARTVEALEHADGRTAYPAAVQYDVYRNGHDIPPPREDLPPSEYEVPYRIVVHDLDLYERLKSMGALDIGHRIAPGRTAGMIDNRAAPGA